MSVTTWYRPMRARGMHEVHRVSTPLELLFDLCFVVAVSQAAAQLHHALGSAHPANGVLHYVMIFFGIWWAWMNFTWFATAYDTDDGVYRATTLVQITGVLIMAAGVPRAFGDDFRIVIVGYVVMRLAMVSQWLRAARSDPERRRTALRYAGGIFGVQLLWVCLPLLPVWMFGVFVLLELAIPPWAEHTTPTSWHPHHIMERYSLFTLIVLGESVLAATTATQAALDSGTKFGDLAVLAASGLLIVFGMWWLYFDRPAHYLLTSLRTSLIWGYSHFAVFASAAAVGAGLEEAVEAHDHIGWAIAVPVAVYVLGAWALQVRPRHEHALDAAHLAAVVLIVLTPLTPWAVPATAVVVVLLVVLSLLLARPSTPEEPEQLAL
ncbi:low temperature requirement protein A [Kutzneria buriramensis]|uniref:Low temperature requirement protein LtrA n=1 Tax=Kutzneria buriramensis TaxID=1045776 RepID=A0A3E0H2P3_9PSEU|nr:low temperature requirement protein LtrA [Kutzneria buriramensis]